MQTELCGTGTKQSARLSAIHGKLATCSAFDHIQPICYIISAISANATTYPQICTDF